LPGKSFAAEITPQNKHVEKAKKKYQLFVKVWNFSWQKKSFEQ